MRAKMSWPNPASRIHRPSPRCCFIESWDHPMSSFKLIGIDPTPFEPLFQQSDRELLEMGAVRVMALKSPGFPCRISLEDARVGEELLLLPYLHQPAASPYRSSGPIFVRRNASQKAL